MRVFWIYRCTYSDVYSFQKISAVNTNFEVRLIMSNLHFNNNIQRKPLNWRNTTFRTKSSRKTESFYNYIQVKLFPQT